MSLDLPGALTATGGLASLVYGLTHAAGNPPGSNWGKTSTWFWIGLGVVLIAAFLVIEGRSKQPLLPLRIIKHRSRGVSYLVDAAGRARRCSRMFFFISLFVQQVLGYSPIKAGVAFLPFTIGIGLSAQVASSLLSRIDPRYVAGSRRACSPAPAWSGSPSSRSTRATGVACCRASWPMSLGLGLLFIPFTLTATHGVGKDEAGIASAVLNTAQQMGGAVGLAALSTVAYGVFRTKIKPELVATQGHPSQHAIAVASTHGYTVAFVVASVMILAAAVITLFGLSIKHEELAVDDPIHIAA